MRFTIITVAYNSARTIRDTLESVQRQSYSDIEHIVIDGASKDETVAIVQKHGTHVSRLVSEPDGGIYDAMNKGLALATGDWVGLLNADDMLAGPDAVRQLAEGASRGADLLYGDLQYVDEHDTSRVVRHWHSGPFVAGQLRHGWMPPHPTFYIRRERFGSLRFNTGYRIAADYDFMLQCLQSAGTRVAYVQEVLVRMRNGGASNHSLKALMRKSREDLRVMRTHGLGGLGTLLSKNLRKVPQFLRRR